jgi:hypothetical protein
MASPQPIREAQDLASLLDDIAERWTRGWTITQIGEELGLSRGAVVGVIARARKHADDRFRLRLTAPKPNPSPKARVLKPVDEAVGNRKPPRPPPKPIESGQVLFLALRPGRCKFPLNSPERGRLWVEMMCCGAPVVRSGANYCQQHAEITRLIVGGAFLLASHH